MANPLVQIAARTHALAPAALDASRLILRDKGCGTRRASGRHLRASGKAVDPGTHYQDDFSV